MIVRSCWTNVPVPEHTTSDEVVTVPCDSTTIQELFERYARGESLGGMYDEFEDDSLFDDVHDPDLQDPLLREANRLNTLDDVKIHSSVLARKRAKKKSTSSTAAPFDASASVRDENEHQSSGESSKGEA